MRDKVGTVIADPTVDIYASEKLISEIEAVMKRPKIQRLIMDESLALAFLSVIKDRILVVNPETEVRVCRDPKDDFILSICKYAILDYLVTGDKDLLVLKSFEGTQIITLEDFMEEL
jgi:putative PIN family toxin of toxin-antitoxin system